MGGKALQLRAPKERSPQTRRAKQNNTGGDEVNLLIVRLRTQPTQRQVRGHRRPYGLSQRLSKAKPTLTFFEDTRMKRMISVLISADLVQRSAFKTIRSVSCDTLPSSPSIIKNNKNNDPHRITQLLWGVFVFCPLLGILPGIPERIFAGLMDGFVWVDRSLSSPLTGRRGQKHFVV